MPLTNHLTLAAAVCVFQTAGVMPQKLYENLDSGDGVWALSELKKHPEWINTHGSQLRESPLLLASCRGHVEVVRWLLKHGASVNSTCYNNFTPLLLAANGQIAEILLKSGAKVDVVSAFGETPMQYAAEQGGAGLKGRLEVVNVMRHSGIPLDIFSALFLNRRIEAREIIHDHPEVVNTEINSNTPLHIAAHNGDIETARLLLAAGASVDAGHQPGMNFGNGTFTPLCCAVWAEQTSMVRFLCEKGSDPNKMGDQLSLALKRSNPQIRALLKKYSAQKHA